VVELLEVLLAGLVHREGKEEQQAALFQLEKLL